MYSIAIASLAYLLTTVATLWLIRRHLIAMRGEVRELAKAVIEEALADGKSRARETLMDASSAVSKQVARIVTRGNRGEPSESSRGFLGGVIAGLADAARDAEGKPEKPVR